MCLASISIHAAWHGAAPFAATSPGDALCLLRSMPKKIEVLFPSDPRRGHAEDLNLFGVSLLEILRYGEWPSHVFMNYLNVNDLETAPVLAAHVNHEGDKNVA